MPAGKFSYSEAAPTLRRMRESLALAAQDHDRDELRLQLALRFIKRYITEEQNAQNEDLHSAVLLIVEFARKHDHLKR
jgi:hypothetical protein